MPPFSSQKQILAISRRAVPRSCETDRCQPSSSITTTISSYTANNRPRPPPCGGVLAFILQTPTTGDCIHEKRRIWKHYLIWQAEVSEEYLSLIASGDEIATLMLIFWCAVMHQTPKRCFVTKWARRTVLQVVVGDLKSDWRDLLAWPLVAFGQTELLMVGRMAMPRPLSWPGPESLPWRRLL
jgi:hypothetical protein